MVEFCSDCGAKLTDEERENWEGCPADEDVDEDGELIEVDRPFNETAAAEIDADELLAELEWGA